MFCPNCGTKINENGAFCPNCGSAVQEETIDISSVLEKEEKPEKVKKTKKKLRIVIACVLAFAILVVGTIGGLKFFGNKNADIIGDVNYTALTEGFTDILVTDEESAIEAVGSIADVLGITNAKKELKVVSVDSVATDKYYRMQQYYKDIPVYGRSIVLSADKENNATALTSNFISITGDFSLKPTATEKDLNKSVQKYFDNDKVTVSVDDSNLVLYQTENRGMVLCYELIVLSNRIVIDANTAEILVVTDLYVQDMVECKYKDGSFQGIKTSDNNYLLGNEEKGIFVFNANYNPVIKTEVNNGKTIFVSVPENSLPMTSTDNYFGNNDSFAPEEYAKAVYMLNTLQSIANYYEEINAEQNTSVIVTINDSFDPDNAFGGYGDVINATSATIPYEKENIISIFFGQDLCNDIYGHLDTLGHEYMHGINHSFFKSDKDESSAIDEAYADIFGELSEALIKKQSPNWIHGQRNMVNPHEYNNAKYPYPASINDLENAVRFIDDGGALWYRTTDNINDSTDFSHFASTIISHCAYLMWNGIDGSAQGKIQQPELGELWYRSLLFLQDNADFEQCRNSVELAARSMLKNNEINDEQYKTVITAFERVGIDNAVFTYSKTVKNRFDLSVLTNVDSGVVNASNEVVEFNLEVIKMPTIKAGPGIVNNEMPKLIMEKTEVVGQQTLDLKDGTYVLRITDINNSKNISKTIDVKIIVDGDNSNAKDKVIVNTDFTPVIVVILNDKLSNNKDEQNNESEETLKSKLTAQTTKTIQAFTCEDFDNDGKKEAFAFVGDKENDDAFGELFTGELWYINDNTVKQLKSYSTMMTNMYSKINYVVDFSDRKFLCLNNLCGNYSLSEIWCIVDGKPKECNISGYGQGTVTVEHNAVALTNSTYDAVYDSSTNSYIGHTWKPYYYYWDESTKDFKEYGGVKITKEQFLNIKGASDIINTILNGGNEIVNILYRENGMININYKNNNSYDNANLLYNEKSNTLEVLKSGFTTPRDTLASSYGGTYQEEIIESIATYPKKLPEVFNNTSSKPTESTTSSTTQNRPETPKYPLEGEYDEVLAKGDGYYLVSKFEESYDSAATLYGVVSDAGTWVCPLSANNEFAKAANNIQDGYSQSYHKIEYEYLGDKIFVIKNCSIILGRETIPSGYWGVYESHGGCVMVDVNGKYINSGGYIITEFKDGYAFTECGNAGLVYRLDKNGNQTKVRYVDDYFGIPSEGLVCLSYIFYDIETLTPTIDLNEYDMVTKSKDLRFKNGELYFEFKNPAGTKYHVKIDKIGKFLYDPVKMD